MLSIRFRYYMWAHEGPGRYSSRAFCLRFLRIGCGVVFESLLVDGHHLYVGDAIDEPGQDGAQILRQK